ncbi:uncharacterized protein LOC134933641 [Pseudophryne corroboree]|uniref:uncharacterized protein LOC134933641 n=1 Tax=Pseudophryne corroboree TaxID=495146 RepID=UPI003081C925
MALSNSTPPASPAAKKTATELFQKDPSQEYLWRVKSPEYHNKNKSNAALDELTNYSLTEYPEASPDWVKRKIQNFRTVFYKEYKITTAGPTGSSAGERHQTKLWYYNLLLFTVEQVAVRPSRNTLEEDLLDESEDKGESPSRDMSTPSLEGTPQPPLSQTTGSGTEMMTESTNPSQSTPEIPKGKPQKSEHTASAASSFLSTAEKVLNTPPDHLAMYGSYLIGTLRLCSEPQQIKFEKLCNELLNRAITHVTHNTAICENTAQSTHPYPYNQQQPSSPIRPTTPKNPQAQQPMPPSANVYEPSTSSQVYTALLQCESPDEDPEYLNC